jgi:bilirubin oxidase
MDTAVFVNGTLRGETDLPAQVVRLRLLNASSMRSFYFGFSNDMTFYQVATDGGLVGTPNAITRLLLAPGERSEVLVDLAGMNGQELELMSYASEMPDGVFGSPNVGIAPDTIDMYDENFLNGADFPLVTFHVVAQTASPVTTIPATLVSYTPFSEADMDVSRTIVFDTIALLPGEVPSLAEGPFGMNNATFDMDSINIVVPLNSTEIWTLKNNTHIAHPFHIHDIQFNVIEKSGTTPPVTEQGWKDVVLVMPHDSVKFITKFTTFSDEMTPYMYHCHLLHHEDDGMMGSFLVVDPFAGLGESDQPLVSAFPNPANDMWNLSGSWKSGDEIRVIDAAGKVLITIRTSADGNVTIPNTGLQKGIYYAIVPLAGSEYTLRLEKH